MKKLPSQITIGIIGGRGKMGQWFAHFFRRLKYEVLISGRKTKLTNKKLAKRADVIIFSVPIEATAKVIKEVLPYVRAGSLLTDLTSIKEAPVKTMLKAPSNIEVIGMHPVFGPSVKSIKNQTIVLCPTRGKTWLGWLKKILVNHGAKLMITSPKEHDEIMTVVQSLTHLQLICSGLVLEELKIKPQKIIKYSSPVYKIQMSLMGRVLSQNPELYAQIAISNKKIKEISKIYLTVTQNLIKTINDGNVEDYIAYFKKAASFFGNFKSTAFKKSVTLIENLPDD